MRRVAALTLLALAACAAPVAAAPVDPPAGPIQLSGAVRLTRVGDDVAQVAFRTRTALPRRDDGYVLARVRVVTASASVGSFDARVNRYTAFPRATVVAGRRYLVRISIAGQEPIARRVTAG